MPLCQIVVIQIAVSGEESRQHESAERVNEAGGSVVHRRDSLFCRAENRGGQNIDTD